METTDTKEPTMLDLLAYKDERISRLKNQLVDVYILLQDITKYENMNKWYKFNNYSITQDNLETYIKAKTEEIWKHHHRNY